MDAAVRVNVFHVNIRRELKVIVPDEVDPVTVPEKVPVGDRDKVIEYGPRAVSTLTPALSYTPTVTENVVRLLAG